MKKALKIFFLTILSVFPITELLERVENMDEPENTDEQLKKAT